MPLTESEQERLLQRERLDQALGADAYRATHNYGRDPQREDPQDEERLTRRRREQQS